MVANITFYHFCCFQCVSVNSCIAVNTWLNCSFFYINMNESVLLAVGGYSEHEAISLALRGKAG